MHVQYNTSNHFPQFDVRLNPPYPPANPSSLLELTPEREQNVRSSFGAAFPSEEEYYRDGDDSPREVDFNENNGKRCELPIVLL